MEFVFNAPQLAAFSALVVAILGLVGVLYGHRVQYKLGKQKAELDRVSFMVDRLEARAKESEARAAEADARASDAVKRMDEMDDKIYRLRNELGDSRDENSELKVRLGVMEAKVDAAEEYIVELLAWGEDGAPPPPPARRMG